MRLCAVLSCNRVEYSLKLESREVAEEEELNETSFDLSFQPTPRQQLEKTEHCLQALSIAQRHSPSRSSLSSFSSLVTYLKFNHSHSLSR